MMAQKRGLPCRSWRKSRAPPGEGRRRGGTESLREGDLQRRRGQGEEKGSQPNAVLSSPVLSAQRARPGPCRVLLPVPSPGTT